MVTQCEQQQGGQPQLCTWKWRAIMMCQWLLGRCCSALCCIMQLINCIIKPVGFTIAYSSCCSFGCGYESTACWCVLVSLRRFSQVLVWANLISYLLSIFPFLGMLFSGISPFLSKSIEIYRNHPCKFTVKWCVLHPNYRNVYFVSTFWVWDLCGPVAFLQAVWH